jgi:hypothetical protein
MDTDNIFDLFNDFEKKDGTPAPKEPQDSLSDDFVSVNSFVRLILDLEATNRNMLVFLKQVYKDLDTEKLAERNKLLIYAQAYQFIAGLDLNNQEHLDALLETNSEDFIVACDKMIYELSLFERYEECAFLKNLKDFTLFSQKKLLL